MNKKRILTTAIVLGILCVLVYFQVQHWRSFDWGRLRQASRVDFRHIVSAIVLIYITYILRALRWRIFLEPARKTSTSRLIGPTFIGFTGMALLGRPGEFIRPYLIARKENLKMSSQLAVWTVERIFDMGAFAVIMAVNVLWFADTLRQLPGFAAGPKKSVAGFHLSAFAIFQVSGIALLWIVAGVAFLAFWIRRNPDKAAAFFRGIFGAFSPRLGEGAYPRVH